MGEARSFETPIVSDLWPVGFDVDLTLDQNSNRKSITSTGFGNSSSSTSHHVGSNLIGLPYGEMQNILLHRFDDFNEGDISQITDLTNSLPKGDNEAAQACYELTSHINNTHENASKGFETTLFDPINPVGSSKQPLHPVDVYGRVTLYEGKLVIQLRHFNINTNYPVSVGECWLCREKIGNGSQIHSHKHVLEGLFQVNDEFVQMDIDHYIIPEQVLEPDHGEGRSISHLNSLHIGEKAEKDIALNEGGQNLSHSQVNVSSSVSDNLHGVNPIGLAMTIGSSDKTHPQMEYTESNFVNLHTQQTLNSSTNNEESALVGFSNNSSINKNLLSSDLQNIDNISDGHSGLSPLSKNSLNLSSELMKSTSAVESVNSPNAMQRNMGNVTNMSSLNATISILSQKRNAEFASNSMYDPNISRRDSIENNQNFFDNHNYYPYEQNFNSQNTVKFPINSLSTLPSCGTYQILNPPQEKKIIESRKKAETGARKRKSRTQKKPSTINIREEEKQPDIPLTNNTNLANTGIAYSNVSFEDWFHHTLSNDTGKLKKSSNYSEIRSSSLLKTEVGKCEEQNKITKLNSSSISTSATVLSPAQPTHDVFKNKEKRSNVDVKKIKLNQKKQNKILELQVMCQICKMEFKNNLTLFKTHLQEHNLSPSFVFLCSLCSKSFSYIDKFIQHLQTHYRNRIPCKLCSNTFCTIDKFERHMETTHNTKSKQHKCHLCSKSFHRADYLKSHLNVHAGKRFQCNICQKFYSSSYNLQVHLKNHSNNKPFACELCDKSYPRKRFLAAHILNVHENKKYDCDICLKLFSRPDVLARHKAIHSNIKVTYDCEVCGKKFHRKDRLKAHSANHQSPSKNKCTLCPASFSRKESLINHVNIHRNKEQCNICFKFIPTTATLQNHLRWHKRQFKVKLEQKYLASHSCELCSKSFKSKELMQRHILRVHYNKGNSKEIKVKPVEREKKFFCEQCSKGFTRSCNLRAHLKVHSIIESEDEEILDGLPTVLNTTKNSSLKTNFLSHGSDSLITDENIPNDNPQFVNLSKGTASSTFHLPLDNGFVPVSASTPLTAYNSHFHPSLSSELPISTSSFCNTSPNSPINLSTEAITAAAYLLAHPFYEGPYQ